MSGLVLTDDYRYVALIASLIGFQLTVTGFWAGGQRKKHFTRNYTKKLFYGYFWGKHQRMVQIFTPEFLKDNFQEEHEKHFPGTQVSKEAYPDMGNGRYSQKLPYKSWYTRIYEFNNAQRVHYNYLESATIVITWLLIAGLRYEWVAVGAGSVYLLARLIYAIGQTLIIILQSKGPAGRVIGFALAFFSSLVLMVFAILSPLRLAGVY